jgi:hypothetical protein
LGLFLGCSIRVWGKTLEASMTLDDAISI